MKKTVLMISILTSGLAHAESPIKVEIKDLTNLANSTALEVCGEATHDQGVKPLLVNIKHDLSSYTTVTDQDGKWCLVFKRWTNSGKVNVSASTMDYKESAVESKIIE